MVEFVRIRLVLAAVLLLAAAPQLHAQNSKALASLTEASKLLDKGVPVKAIEIIDETLKSGSIPADLAAKAMMLRAQAQEKLGKYAYALADYNSALWMEDLSARDKSEAEKGRERILAKLGVSGSAEKNSASEAPPAQEPAKQRAASSGSSKSWDTEVQRSSEQRTGGIGSVFGGIFGSSEASPAPQQPSKPSAPPQVQQVRATPADDPPAPSVKPEAPVKVAANEPQETILTANAQQSGDFAIQFAALLSEDSAIYEVDRVAKRYGDMLGGRTPSITVRGTSDGGTLYKIIAEPYERGEGLATCELLKTKGVSCMLISR